MNLRSQYEQSLDKVTQYETKMRTIIEARQAIRARLDAAYQDRLNSTNAVCCPYCHASVPKGEMNCPLCGKMLEQSGVLSNIRSFSIRLSCSFPSLRSLLSFRTRHTIYSNIISSMLHCRYSSPFCLTPIPYKLHQPYYCKHNSTQ